MQSSPHVHDMYMCTWTWTWTQAHAHVHVHVHIHDHVQRVLMVTTGSDSSTAVVCSRRSTLVTSDVVTSDVIRWHCHWNRVPKAAKVLQSGLQSLHRSYQFVVAPDSAGLAFGGHGHLLQPSPRGLLTAPPHGRCESFMRKLARHASQRVCTGSGALTAWRPWKEHPAHAVVSVSSPEEPCGRRTRLWCEGLPAHRHTPRGPQASKEEVVRTMLPCKLTVPAACQTR
jgi:hypothetical protein